MPFIAKPESKQSLSLFHAKIEASVFGLTLISKFSQGAAEFTSLVIILKTVKDEDSNF